MTLGPIMSPAIMPAAPLAKPAKSATPDPLDTLARAIKLYAVIQSEDQFAFEYATRKLSSRRKARLQEFLNASDDPELVGIAQEFIDIINRAYPNKFTIK